MDVLLDALGYQARQPHQEDVSTSSTDAHEELTADVDVPTPCARVEAYFAVPICASGEARTAITSHSSSESWLMA
jgi:hypothetical protein